MPIQKRATKLVISVKHLPYEERLKRLNLPTLKYRCLRGDMIEVFKLLNNFYDKKVDFMLPLKPAFSTRGNSYKLQNYSFHYDLRKYSFCPRVTKVWNSLPDFVVNVDTVNMFKVHLDKFWQHQQVVFDFKAELTGTGNRSEYVFTALHGMQTRSCDEISVCPSIRPSVKRVHCDKTEENSVQIFTARPHCSQCRALY